MIMNLEAEEQKGKLDRQVQASLPADAEEEKQDEEQARGDVGPHLLVCFMMPCLSRFRFCISELTWTHKELTSCPPLFLP